MWGVLITQRPSHLRTIWVRKARCLGSIYTTTSPAFVVRTLPPSLRHTQALVCRFPDELVGMSASGYKQTYGGVSDYVRFTPESGHSEVQERLGLKKQTSDVRYYPESGRKWVTVFMSANDPKRTSSMMKSSFRNEDLPTFSPCHLLGYLVSIASKAAFR